MMIQVLLRNQPGNDAPGNRKGGGRGHQGSPAGTVYRVRNIFVRLMAFLKQLAPATLRITLTWRDSVIVFNQHRKYPA